jgi:hypothetical protein
MWRYQRVRKLSKELFQRLTGVSKTTFDEMVFVLRQNQQSKKVIGGAPKSLRTEDCLLLCLEYLREYRTLFHIAIDYGVSTSTAWRTIRWVEEVLLSQESFHLPGKKVLKRSDMQFEVIVVDASESPIQRPKKKLEMEEG